MFAAPENRPQRAPTGAESSVELYPERVVKRHYLAQTYTAEKEALIDLANGAHIPTPISFDDHSLTVVMQRAPGIALREMLPRNCYEGIELHLAERVFKHLAVAVHEIHRAGWLHNDLTLENIFYDAESDSLTVIDFGRALNFQDKRHIENQICGNTLGASPEKVAQKLPLTSASDVYSLGNIYFELMEGMFPFEDGYNDLAFQIMHTTPLAPERGTKELQHLVVSMLAKSPSDRPTVLEILRQLDADSTPL